MIEKKDMKIMQLKKSNLKSTDLARAVILNDWLQLAPKHKIYYIPEYAKVPYTWTYLSNIHISDFGHK